MIPHVPKSAKGGRHLLRKLILAGIALVAVIVVTAVLFLDAAAARIVGIAGTKVLGVDTAVSSVHIALLGGTSSVSELTVAQPAGFSSDKMLDVKYAGVTLRLSELLNQDIAIDEVKIDGIDVLLAEKDGKVNLQVVSDNLASKTAPAKTPESAPPKDTSPEKTVTIKLVTVTAIKVRVQGMMTAGQMVAVDIPDIQIKNLGNKMPMSEVAKMLSSELIGRLTTAIVEAKISGLSDAMVGGLNDAASQLDKLILKDAGSAIEGGAKGIGDGLKDIFGNPKK
ncbi:MAG: AsmA family protein [Planctomycetes bacterium]|nr:AsmA family protein [Planctomycetota bacterium]